MTLDNRRALKPVTTYRPAFILAALCLSVGCSSSTPSDPNESQPIPDTSTQKPGSTHVDSTPQPVEPVSLARIETEAEPVVLRLPPETPQPFSAEMPLRERPPAREQNSTSQPDSAPRYVIIHADDAGMCHSANLGTIDVLEAGIVTSASIMVPCPGFEEFAEYARNHPEYDYGIHLTLNAEYKYRRWKPVLPVREVPSLVDPEGYMWREGFETAGNARADDVERELRAQIDRALEFGVPISHLDTHMGTLFRRPDLVDIYLQLGIDYDVPVLLSRGSEFFRMLEIDHAMIPQLRNAVSVLDDSGYPAVDRILIHYKRDSIDQKRRTYLNMIRQAPAGVTEIVIHCARNDRDIRSFTSKYQIRTGDRDVFTDPQVIAEIRQSGVQLINWKQLRQLTAATSE